MSADGAAVRQVFQHLLLFGLVVVTAVGLSGLLEAVIAPDSAPLGDTAVARSVAFTVVGAPLLVGLGRWTRRTATADAGELRSRAWILYLAWTELVALFVTVLAAYDVLGWLLDLRGYDASAAAGAVVWAVVWAVHWWIGKQQADQLLLQPQRILGSIIGLALTMLGLGAALTGTLRAWAGLGDGAVVVGRHEPILEGLVTLALGGAVWGAYWWHAVRRTARTPPWFAHVLLAGVATGLLVALVGGSLALHRTAVWLVGNPWETSTRLHFDPVPAYVAAAVVGLLSLAYHRGLVPERRERNEVDRIRDHLLAAIALGTAATGTVIVVVALVEALTEPTVLTGGGAANTLLAALTLLLVGVPVWWLSWRRCQHAAATGTSELTSPVRRIYVFTLLGLSSLAAVLALLIGAWLLVDALLQDESAREVLEAVRVPMGILVTAAVVSAYHWQVHLAGRGARPTSVPRSHDFVLLLGVADQRLADRIAGATGATTWAWSRGTDDRVWPEEDLLAALGRTPAREVVVLADPIDPAAGTGSARPGADSAAMHLRALPVERRPVR